MTRWYFMVCEILPCALSCDRVLLQLSVVTRLATPFKYLPSPPSEHFLACLFLFTMLLFLVSLTHMAKSYSSG